VDVYARSDITALAQGNAYNRLQWEDVTVRQGAPIWSQPCLHQQLAWHPPSEHWVHAQVGQALLLTTVPGSSSASSSQTWNPAQQGGSSLSLNQHPAMGGLSAELQAQQQRQVRATACCLLPSHAGDR
jgi:hypothetical protein